MKKTMRALCAAFIMGGCAGAGQASIFGHKGNTNMQAADSQPAAEGSAKFKKTGNDNTEIDVRVKHLAHPDRLNPSESTYVLWTQRDDKSAPQNIGALRVDKELTGRLNTESPLHKFDLFITAEPNGQVDKPSGPRQLWTNYSR